MKKSPAATLPGKSSGVTTCESLHFGGAEEGPFHSTLERRFELSVLSSRYPKPSAKKTKKCIYIHIYIERERERFRKSLLRLTSTRGPELR